MNSKSFVELSLGYFLTSRISLSKLEDLILPLSMGLVDTPDPDAVELADKILLCIAERSSGHLSAAELRTVLSDLQLEEQNKPHVGFNWTSASQEVARTTLVVPHAGNLSLAASW